MTEHQDKTIKVDRRGTVERLCLTCGKTFETSVQVGAEEYQSCPSDGTQLMPLPLLDTPLVGNYLYKGLLGVGGMGVVYKALNPYLDKMVAVKSVKGKKYDAKQLSRFMQEGKLLSKLVHPNLVSVLDFGANKEGEPYMVMEYLDGQSLATLINEAGILPQSQALEILIQTCEGLAHAHKFGAVHRDIKPSNIFVVGGSSRQPVVKLLDFGIAKLCFPEDPVAAQDLTRTGEIFGSPLYMSPEQALGKTVDERSDLYSLGCVMYEMLSGHPPLVGKTAMETIFKHVSEDPLPLSQTTPHKKYPPTIQEVLTCLLVKDPADRIESAERLRDILVSVISANTAELQQLRAKARSLNLRAARENVRRPPDKSGSSNLLGPILRYGSVVAALAVIASFSYYLLFKPARPEAAALLKTPALAPSAADMDREGAEGLVVQQLISPTDDAKRRMLMTELSKGRTVFGLDERELTMSDFQILAERGQDISTLTFRSDSGLSAANLSFLQKLPVRQMELVNCDDLHDDGLAALAGIATLRDLIIKDCADLSPSALLCLKKALHLNRLHVEGCAVAIQTLKEIFPRPHLRSLEIRTSVGAILQSGPETIQCNAALPEIGRCPDLREIDLHGTDADAYGLKGLALMKDLLKLDLSNCKKVDDRAVDSLIKLSGLNKLNLTNTAITHKGLERLLQNGRVKNVILGGRSGILTPYLEEQAVAGRLQF